MTDRPPPRLGADAPTEDSVGIAIGGGVFGVGIGVCLNGLVVFSVRTIQANRPPPPSTRLDLNSPEALLLLFGTFGACLAAAVAAWIAMHQIRNPYRQGMFAIVTFFASFLFSLLTQFVDQTMGRSGLLGLSVVAALGCWRQWHRLARLPTP